MRRTLIPLSTLRSILIYILLMALTLYLSQNGIQYAYGAEFILCSSVLLLLSGLFGWAWGAVSALSLTLSLYYTQHGSIILLLIGLEILIVGFLHERTKRPLLLLDGLYWFGIGAPLATLFFYLQTYSFNSEAILQYFMFAMNGLLNVFIADVLLTFVPWHRIIPRLERKLVSLNQLLAHLCMIAVFIPFMINLVLDSHQMRSEIEADSLSLVESQSRVAMDWANNLSMKDKHGLYIRNEDNIKQLEQKLNLFSLNHLLKIAVYDREDKLMASTDAPFFNKMNMIELEKQGIQLMELEPKQDQPVQEKKLIQHRFYQWLPSESQYDYDTRRWNDGYYVLIKQYTDLPMQKIITLIPIAVFSENTISLYLSKFLNIFILCLIVGAVAFLITRYISRVLNQLMTITTGMPAKLITSQSITWPMSRISDIRALENNFRTMSERLIEVFYEMRRMNDKLRNQTNKLENSEERLQQLAYYDPLTQLPNRYHFTSKLEEAIERAEENEGAIALMFLDLDRFKHINDSLGHNVGDLLLVRVAQRLSSQISRLQGSAMIARLGGDEFVVLLEDYTKADVKKVAERIVQVFHDSFFVLSYELFVSPSIGIAMYPEHGKESTVLLKRADTAMYAAKDRGGQNAIFYDELHSDQLHEMATIEGQLRKALDRQELILNYQPIVDSSGRVSAAEALIRWNHPEHGFISPAKFIPIAEETGLIIRIGEWVLRTACIQHREWVESNKLPPFDLSVNVSLRQFLNQDFVEMVDRILAETRFDPERLVLEITEGYVNKNVEHGNHVLNQLKNRGIRIAIDDFGTGYSSLSRLKTLPIHVLKIDRSFIRYVQNDSANASIVEAVIHIGKSMNLKVMSEGVETMEELRFLRSVNCHQYQGYLISPPLPAHEFQARFREFSMPLQMLMEAKQ
ncbi:putative bifunctional diguanylate cyclase/phosphodiesterase [Paenibacillus sp. 1001270B_150601_E10]|uniref:putative bifunctional diguanylate cyclase/phosphodiesterase n=1 Tax=Paenibacillus sp. 1001270B_150601_E10 TaxID=2787079 RepID=UPI001E415F52|nr:EAL domain-containing protein [Paenibacillus sp. 1001270B_150601_E10]